MKLSVEFPATPDFQRLVASLHSNLANLLSDTGRFSEAQTAYRESLAVAEKLSGEFSTTPRFQDLLAVAHHNLGNLLYRTARFREAEAAFRHA